MTRRVVVSWSTGKDSAWCLHTLRADPTVEVVGLLTTVTGAFNRVAIHGTRRSVLDAQAAALRLPVYEVDLPYPCDNRQYEAAMGGALEALVGEANPSHVAFGDLFLADVRAYRERLLEGSGVEPLFPLWGRDTRRLADAMRSKELDAVIVSAPDSSPAAGLVGTQWDPGLLAALDDVDPCGERGEFHTCVIGGPDWPRLPVVVGPVIRRDGSVFADVEMSER